MKESRKRDSKIQLSRYLEKLFLFFFLYQKFKSKVDFPHLIMLYLQEISACNLPQTKIKTERTRKK